MFDLRNSHVLPALIRRFHEATPQGDGAMVIWGTGTPRREFLNVDDLAKAIVHLMRGYDGEELVNVGCGNDFTIRELAGLVAETVEYAGRIVFDTSEPDGTLQKLLDVREPRPWAGRPAVGLREGIAATYAWYRAH